MIAKARLTQGSGGGSIDTEETESDPFSGGKTGSEVIAEGGSPASVTTIDPKTSSVQEEIEQEGTTATVQTFTDLAQDGNDPNKGTTFDNVPNNEQGKKDLQDTAKSIAGAAKAAANNDKPQNKNQNKPTPSVIPPSVEPPKGMDEAGAKAKAILLAVIAGIAMLVFNWG